MNCLMQNLVVDIGDVANKGDIKAGCNQPASQNIEVHSAANMADMRIGLNGRATEINTHLASIDWRERRDAATSSVI